MDTERLRLDILKTLFSIKYVEKSLTYQKLRDRLPDVEDVQLTSELMVLCCLRLIDVQNGLTQVIEGSSPIGGMAITSLGETYLEEFFKRRGSLLMARSA